MTRAVRAVPAAPVNLSGLPLTVNLSLYEGDDFWLDLTVSDQAGAAADLTGMVARSVIRKTTDTTTQPMASFTCSIAGNVVSLHLPSTEAAQLASSGVWDCQIATTGAPPIVTTLAAGTVTVVQQVTV